MNNPKADAQLNQALNATEAERDKSLELNVGYNAEDREWDLIIKHSGDAETLCSYVIGITELLNGYAVVRIHQSRIEEFTSLPQIQYVEKPKRLFFASYQAQAVSCINVVKEAPYNLSGEGVLVACVDSGIDYKHMDFRNADGSTRLVALWDQTLDGRDMSDSTVQKDATERSAASQAEPAGKPPEGYFIGIEFTKEQLDEILFSEMPSGSNIQEESSTADTTARDYDDVVMPSPDFSGHGTAVMGIAAGNGQESGGIYEGVAPKSDLLVVKLAAPLPNSFPRTTELIQAIDYCVRKAMERNQPMALNLSFGSSYGSREGNSLVESYLNQVSDLGRMAICVGVGNEGRSAGHTSIQLGSSVGAGSRSASAIFENRNLSGLPNQNISFATATETELAVGRYQTAFNLQIWKNYVDDIEIELESPSGERVTLGQTTAEARRGGTERYSIGDSDLLFYYGVPSPYSTAQELYLDFIPKETYIEEGRWIIRVTGNKIVNGIVDFYLPGGGILNENTRFLTPTPERSLTIPSASAGVISVGAYDSRLNSYANFSGRGYTREIIQVKPDLAAPGVNIRTVKSGGGYAAFTGTSFATPFVTGSAALMMEWGILNGNEPYLYGEALKANLRKGARRLPGITQWPNPELGYGVLCLRDSLPE